MKSINDEKENIQMVCIDCTNKMQKTAQDYIKRRGIDIGDFVKKKVKSKDGQIEHMWFKVLSVAKKSVMAELANEHIYEQKINFGDKLRIKKKDIIDVGRFA
jgi:uncharacterized protein YegJ (DUF2314 family)